MDLFDLVAKITLDSSEYEKGIKGAEEGVSALSSKWAVAGKAVGVVGTATVAAVGAAATAVGVLTKKSVEAYAEYEQLSGGVRKLFGEEASAEVMKYANDAYKTAGMSANQYMEQATSFSAALINSLGGDQMKAAEQTDVAMRAISDNFNTFGGDISNIQNAFQGFAKQNYTMLDNLKLGYGGTKTEMERLIADANEYAEANGMAADLSIDSFSDIVTAIDLIQQKQGIAGTTAKEAATTIEGSLNMTKAAWENLVAGFANPDADLGQLMDDLVVAIVGEGEGEGLLNNIMPAIERALEGIGEVLQQGIPILAEQLPTLIETLLPSLLSAAASLIAGLIEALPTLLAVLIEQIPMILDIILAPIIEAGQKFLNAGKTLISKLASGIWTKLTETASRAVAFAKKIPNAIKRGLGNLRSIGTNLITTLWNGIKSKFTSVISNVLSTAKGIPTAVKDGIGSLYSIGSSVIQGLWDGLKSKWDALIGWFSGAVDSLKEKAKAILGINSPSKVFMEIGKSIPEGLALGIEKNMDMIYDAENAMADTTAFTTSDGVLSTNSAYSSGFAEAVGDIVGDRIADALDGMDIVLDRRSFGKMTRKAVGAI